MLVYTPAHLEQIVNTFNSWFSSEDGKHPKAAFYIIAACFSPDSKPTLIALIFYDGTELEGRKVFKPFFDINPVADLTREMPYAEIVTPTIQLY